MSWLPGTSLGPGDERNFTLLEKAGREGEVGRLCSFSLNHHRIGPRSLVALELANLLLD